MAAQKPARYCYSGPVDCSVKPDMTQVVGKSVIVTGGASGIGEAYVRAFAGAGAYVTFCDVNDEKGNALQKELPSQTSFVKCDTRSWEDQLAVFEKAVEKSPHKSVDIVIGNAGVGRGAGDPLMQLEGQPNLGLFQLIATANLHLLGARPLQQAFKPSTHILDINLIGVIFTFKLAVHFFRRNSLTPERDRCFIFGGSIAGILENLGSWEYSTSKFALRGLMRTVRWHAHHQNLRVSYIAPSYIKTTIQSEEVFKRMQQVGIELATVDSCVAAVMRIACDKSINGHSFAIMPISQVAEGFRDIEEDDWTDENHWLYKAQQRTIALRGDAWD